MRALDGTGLAKRAHLGRAARAHPPGALRSGLPAALPALLMLCWLFVVAAAAGAAPACATAAAPASPQLLAAKLALQQAELNAGDGAALDVFGSSVAVSGNTALVGAPHHTASGKPNAGAAYVFVRSGGSWTQQAELTAIDGAANDELGASVAVSGNTALVGAPLQSVAGTYSVGAAYVFMRSAGVWTQQARLLAADGGSLDRFGSSVAVAGETALIGAPGRMGSTGAAYVFTRSGGVWTQAQLLSAPDGAAYDELGRSVAISGKTALVGAPLHDQAGQVNAGAAYIYTRLAGVWISEGRLTGFDAALSDQFGTSVAVSGETAVVGAPYHGIPGTYNPGVAYVFTRSAGSWPQQAELSAFDAGAGAGFGASVAVSGEIALVGAPSQTSAGKASAGAAYVFARSAGAWSQEAEPLAADGVAGDGFGSSVALSGDAALIGAPNHTTGGQAYAGAAYVFTRSGGAWLQEAEPTAADAAAGDGFGHSIALSGDTALVGAPGHAAYVFARSGGSWPQAAELTAAGLPEGVFADAVALSGDTALVGRSGETLSTGAAYLFTRSTGSWAERNTLTAADGAVLDGFGHSVAVSGDLALVGAPWHSAGAAYAFVSATAPTVGMLQPASGKRGATVTISGASFGAAQGVGFVKFGAKKCAAYLSWSDAQIKCKVPAKAPYGKVRVTVTTTRGVSNARSFTVKR
jgi:hypothetical protein